MKRLLRREKLNDHGCFERDLEVTRETGDRRGTDYINLVITYAALGPWREGTAAWEMLKQIEDARVEEIRGLVEEWKSRLDEN